MAVLEARGKSLRKMYNGKYFINYCMTSMAKPVFILCIEKLSIPPKIYMPIKPFSMILQFSNFFLKSTGSTRLSCPIPSLPPQPNVWDHISFTHISASCTAIDQHSNHQTFTWVKVKASRKMVFHHHRAIGKSSIITLYCRCWKIWVGHWDDRLFVPLRPGHHGIMPSIFKLPTKCRQQNFMRKWSASSHDRRLSCCIRACMLSM